MACLVAIVVCGGPAHAAGEKLTIGVLTETSAIDPHFSLIYPTVSVTRHIFEPLVTQDPRQRLLPGLALSWSAISETEWEFRLRPGVRFQDGHPFTADDVAFSLSRAPNVPNAVSGFGPMTRQITGISVVDAMTVRLRTDTPFPLMAEYLSTVGIVERAVAEGAETKDFNAGRAAIGTGPFRFVSWTPGDSVRLARNDLYWGPAPPWQEVVIRPISDDGARVAALLSGAVDVIDMVPPAAVGALRARADVRLAQTISNRVIFLQINVAPATLPYVTDAAGAPLAANPYRDRRVRLAISKAINRQAITTQVMEGLAVPAGQLLPDGHFGSSPRLKPMPLDIAGARALLAEAGYPQGFGLVLLVQSAQNAADKAIAEALAQMLARIGIRVSLEAVPPSLFLTRTARGEFGLGLRGWSTETGESAMALRALLGTPDPATGRGAVNRGGYSNPAMDAVLAQALASFEPTRREKLVQQAVELGIEDAGLIPIHFQIATWAMRRGLDYAARADSYTFAFEIHPTAAR